ncbi:variant surface glycoprotein (VSG), putative [Trypanosoma equiperdum]|uniref:Variant surface glycoprotein (VSG), putative n=1 Tax=Trypanosoma equiperdum TaxID=5694 RepID=A0A1G4I3Y8_TRYEQ|nr:variant surface glycoprotein (VSG), putative [Trypanosoma equiperdum]
MLAEAAKILAALSLLLSEAKANTAANTLANSASNWCQERHYLTAVVQAMLSEQNDRRGRLAANAARIQAWSLQAAAANTKQQTARFILLREYGKYVQTTGEQTLQTLKTAAEPALKLLRGRIANYNTAIAIADHSVLKIGTTTGSSGTVNGAPCEAATTLHKAQTQLCTAPAANEITTEAVKAVLKSLKAVKLVARIEVHELLDGPTLHVKGQSAGGETWTAGVSSKCTATSGGSQVGSSVTHQAPEPAKLKGTAGTITTTSETSKPVVNDGDDVYTSGVNTPEKLAQALLSVKTELLKQTVDLRDTLETDPVAQALANILLLSDTKRLTPDQPNRSEQLKTLIIKEFGPENTAYSTAFINSYDTAAVTLLVGGKPKSEKLNTITNPENIAKAISYLAATNQIKQTIEGNKDQCSTVEKEKKQSPSKEECKEHTEQEACQNAGCKFDNSKNDGEKCFPNPETKEAAQKDGNDSKNTNTTGSNSFVIKKVPLWLAVFILG